MLIEKVLFPITSLGPGNRLVIWTAGCSKHCYHCSNPELWEAEPEKNIDVPTLVKMIRAAIGDNDVQGITVTGGDPFEQYEELLDMLEDLQGVSKDIAVYTGYTIEELYKNLSADEMERVRRFVAVLIDGRYVEELNDDNCVLRGSTNQKIYFFNEEVRDKYEQYMKNGRKIQNIYYRNEILSVGIHCRERSL